MRTREIFKITWLPILVASLCCLSPFIFVLVGLSTVSFAISLSNVLYETYAWVFRIAGIVLLSVSLIMYFRHRGICTIDEVKKRRIEVINTVLFVFIIAVIGYIVFLYGILEYAAKLSGVEINPQSHIAEPVKPQSANSLEVSFSASDGYGLKGTLWKSLANAPAIVLVHQYGSDRHDFDAFVSILTKEGYTVLAYDIRGFGQSQNGPANINDFPKDVSGAIKFFKSRKDMQPSKFAVLGASVGANVAYVASGSIPDISAAVSLSPSNTGKRGVLLGHDIAEFNPHSIFVASDDKEKANADFIFNSAHKPKEQKTYPGFGHGAALLQSPDAQSDILLFLKKELGYTY